MFIFALNVSAKDLNGQSARRLTVMDIFILYTETVIIATTTLRERSKSEYPLSADERIEIYPFIHFFYLILIYSESLYNVPRSVALDGKIYRYRFMRIYFFSGRFYGSYNSVLVFSFCDSFDSYLCYYLYFAFASYSRRHVHDYDVYLDRVVRFHNVERHIDTVRHLYSDGIEFALFFFVYYRRIH